LVRQAHSDPASAGRDDVNLDPINDPHCRWRDGSSRPAEPQERAAVQVRKRGRRRLRAIPHPTARAFTISLYLFEYSEMTTILANRLTTFSVDAKGATVSIGVADERGEPGALVLPTSCLQALVMTLPEMALQALQRKRGDPQLRLVFPVENWFLETSETADRFILTLATADGFRASFALFLDALVEMAGTALSGRTVAECELKSTTPAN